MAIALLVLGLCLSCGGETSSPPAAPVSRESPGPAAAPSAEDGESGAESPASRRSATAGLLTFQAAPASGHLDELLETLEELVETEVTELAPGTDVAGILRERCGFLSSALIRFFVARNPGVWPVVSDEPVTVKLPPCPRWRFGGDFAVEVRHGQTWWEIAKTFMGAEGGDTIRDLRRVNPHVSAETTGLRPGEEIRVPYATLPVTYRLREQWVGRGEEVERRLRESSLPRGRSRFPSVDVTSDAEHITPIEAEANSARLGCSGASASWPLDPDALLAALARTRSLAGGQRLRQAVVAVADSGMERAYAPYREQNDCLEEIDFGTSPQRFLFSINERELGCRSREDDDYNGFDDDVIGAGLQVKSLPPWIEPEYGSADHGLHVAGLVFGVGSAYSRLRPVAEDRIRLKVLNLVFKVTTIERVDFRRPPMLLRRAITYSKGPTTHADVVNFSFGVPWDFREMRQDVDGGSPLIVAAAGNRGDDLSLPTNYYSPARLGGSGSPHVVTVAAHDGDGRLAPFSNYSVDYVDLAAPGCEIESLTLGGGTASYSGTSQAAPQVSFGAALLFSEGLADAVEIKQRLVSTVDVVDDLKDKVASGGKMNLARAVRIYEDFVEQTDGTEVWGRFADDQEVELCGRKMPLDWIVRLDPHFWPVSSGEPIRAVYSGAEGEHIRRRCTSSSSHLDMWVEGEPQPRRLRIAIADIRTLVPRIRDPR